MYVLDGKTNKRNTKIKTSGGDLLREIDKSLMLSKGFLTRKGRLDAWCGKRNPGPLVDQNVKSL